MNLKIKDAELCFKISKEELETLCAGEIVGAKVSLGTKMLSIKIALVENESFMKVAMNNHFIQLLVPCEKLEELSDMGRNRDGVRDDQEGTTLILQVDLRTDKREVQKR